MRTHAHLTPTLESYPWTNAFVDHLQFAEQSGTVVPHLQVLNPYRFERIEHEPAAIEHKVNEVVPKASAHQAADQVCIDHFVERFKGERTVG